MVRLLPVVLAVVVESSSASTTTTRTWLWFLPRAARGPVICGTFARHLPSAEKVRILPVVRIAGAVRGGCPLRLRPPAAATSPASGEGGHQEAGAKQSPRERTFHALPQLAGGGAEEPRDEAEGAAPTSRVARPSKERTFRCSSTGRAPRCYRGRWAFEPSCRSRWGLRLGPQGWLAPNPCRVRIPESPP